MAYSQLSYPYGVPVNYVVKGDAIFIHGAAKGQKLESIERNKNVSFCVVGNTKILPDEFTTAYESVIVFGTAHIIDGEEKCDALELILEKFTPECMEKGIKLISKAQDEVAIIKIIIENISGKAKRQE